MNDPKTLDPKMLSALFGVKVDKPTGSYGQTTREGVREYGQQAR